MMDIHLGVSTEAWNAIRFTILSIIIYPLLELIIRHALARSRAIKLKKGKRVRLRSGWSRVIDFNQELDQKSIFELALGYFLAVILLAMGLLAEYGSGTIQVPVAREISLGTMPEIELLRNLTTPFSTPPNILAGVPTDPNVPFRKLFSAAATDDGVDKLSIGLFEEAAMKKLHSAGMGITIERRPGLGNVVPSGHIDEKIEISVIWEEYGMMLNAVRLPSGLGYPPGIALRWSCHQFCEQLPLAALVSNQSAALQIHNQGDFILHFTQLTDVDNFVNRLFGYPNEPDMINHMSDYWQDHAIEVGDVAGLRGSMCWRLEADNEKSTFDCNKIPERITQTIRSEGTNGTDANDRLVFSVTPIESREIQITTKKVNLTWELLTGDDDDDEEHIFDGIYYQQVGKRVKTYYSLRSRVQKCIMEQFGVCVTTGDNSSEVAFYRQNGFGWASRRQMGRFRGPQGLPQGASITDEEILVSWHAALVKEKTLATRIFTRTTDPTLNISATTGNVLDMVPGTVVKVMQIAQEKERATVNMFFILSMAGLLSVLVLATVALLALRNQERIDTETMLKREAMSKNFKYSSGLPRFPPDIGMVRTEINSQQFQAFYDSRSSNEEDEEDKQVSKYLSPSNTDRQYRRTICSKTRT